MPVDTLIVSVTAVTYVYVCEHFQLCHRNQPCYNFSLWDTSGGSTNLLRVDTSGGSTNLLRVDKNQQGLRAAQPKIEQVKACCRNMSLGTIKADIQALI